MVKAVTVYLNAHIAMGRIVDQPAGQGNAGSRPVADLRHDIAHFNAAPVSRAACPQACDDDMMLLVSAQGKPCAIRDDLWCCHRMD